MSTVSASSKSLNDSSLNHDKAERFYNINNVFYRQDKNESDNKYLTYVKVFELDYYQLFKESLIEQLLDLNEEDNCVVIQFPGDFLKQIFGDIEQKYQEMEIPVSDIAQQSYEQFDNDTFILSNNKVSKKVTKKKFISINEYKDLFKNYKELSTDENIKEILEKNIQSNVSVYYASSIKWSLFEKYYPKTKEMKIWNISNLKGIISGIGFKKDDEDEVIEKLDGIHNSYTYVGSPGSVFAVHAEDGNLISINIQLCGAPKVWFIIKKKHTQKFEEKVNCFLKDKYRFESCENPINHKNFIITEDYLIKNEIEYIKIIQKPGMAVITLPGCYHGGFNCGNSINEAINFATPKTVRHILHSKECNMDSKNSVHCPLSMKKYVQNKVKNHRTPLHRRISYAPNNIGDEEKKRQAQRDNFNEIRTKQNTKVQTSVKIKNETVEQLLNFLLQENSCISNIYIGTNVFKKFIVYCETNNYKLLPVEKKYKTMTPRIKTQIYDKIFLGNKYHLSDEHYIILLEKLKNNQS